MKEIFSPYGWKNDNNFIPVFKEDLYNYGYQMDALGSEWLGMNLLSIDESTLVCEAKQDGLTKKLQNHGFRVLSVPMPHMRDFAGASHCTTLHLDRDS